MIKIIDLNQGKKITLFFFIFLLFGFLKRRYSIYIQLFSICFDFLKNVFNFYEILCTKKV